MIDQLVGPAVITAQRVIAMDVEPIERALIKHLDEEAFRVQRQQPGRITLGAGLGVAGRSCAGR